MATKITIQVISTNVSTGETEQTNIGYVNPELFDEADHGAAKIDTAARALINLTTNSYYDTNLVSTESINEILAE